MFKKSLVAAISVAVTIAGVTIAGEGGNSAAGTGHHPGAHGTPPHDGTPRAQALVPAGTVSATASWAFRPQTVEELVAQTDLLIEGRVLGVRAGAPLVPYGRDEHATEIPTERVAVRIADVLSGNATLTGTTISLFRTGGPLPESSGRLMSLEGDPPYQGGEQYFLFLRSRGDGTFIPAAPDGRLLLDEHGLAQPLIEGPVGEQLRGKNKAEIARASRGGRGA